MWGPVGSDLATKEQQQEPSYHFETYFQLVSSPKFFILMDSDFPEGSRSPFLLKPSVPGTGLRPSKWTANGINKPSLPWSLFLFAFSQVVPSVWNTLPTSHCMAHLPTLGRHPNMASQSHFTQEAVPIPGPGVCPAMWANNSCRLFSQPFPGFCRCSSKQPLLNQLLDWEMLSTPPSVRNTTDVQSKLPGNSALHLRLPSWHLFHFSSSFPAEPTCL